MLTVCALTLGVTSVTPNSAEAYSGFTRSQGTAYVKLALSTFTSNDFYDLAPNLNDRGQDFTQRNLSIYAEYGIIDGLTAIINAPLLRVNSYANTNTALGFGDVQLELKYGVDLAGIKIAASLAPEFPTGDANATVQTESGLNLILPTGDGEFNVWSRIAVSYGLPLAALPWLDGWVSAGAGYNVRTDGFSNQVGFGAELGTRWWGLLIVQARMRGQFVPSDELKTSGGFIYGEGTEFITVGAGLAAVIPNTNWAVSLDWEQPVAAQRNLYSGSVLVAGVSMSL